MALQIGHEFVQALVEALTDPVGQMEVDLGGGDIGVSEDFLESGDVFAVLQQVGGVGVTQGVGRGALIDTGFVQSQLEGVLQNVGADVVSLLLRKQPRAAVAVAFIVVT